MYLYYVNVSVSIICKQFPLLRRSVSTSWSLASGKLLKKSWQFTPTYWPLIPASWLYWSITSQGMHIHLYMSIHNMYTPSTATMYIIRRLILHYSSIHISMTGVNQCICLQHKFCNDSLASPSTLTCSVVSIWMWSLSNSDCQCTCVCVSGQCTCTH